MPTIRRRRSSRGAGRPSTRACRCGAARPENIVGILHAKDLLRAIQAADGDLEQDRRHGDRAAAVVRARHPPAVRAAQGVPPAQDAISRWWSTNTARSMGLVTLEDILEEIVGDISDEHDVPVPGVRPQPDGSVNVDGAVPIRDLNRAMDWNLPDDEATTIAGLVIHEARSIPERRAELHLPRLPLPRAAQGAQPHHRAAHHAAGAQAGGDGAGRRERALASLLPPARWRGSRAHARRTASSLDKRLVDHAVALDPALSAERLRHDIHPEMGLARPADGRHGLRDGGIRRPRRGFAARTPRQASRR